MSDGIILNPTWSPMQTQICIGVLVFVIVVIVVIWLSERTPDVPLVDFKILKRENENGHPKITVQANNREEVARKMEHVTYKGGFFVITHTDEKEFTVQGHSR